jgi:hypothetical protein
VVGAADRLIEQADRCEQVAAWHDEQATVGNKARREMHERAANSYRIIELSLRLVAEALDDDEEAA